MVPDPGIPPVGKVHAPVAVTVDLPMRMPALGALFQIVIWIARGGVHIPEICRRYQRFKYNTFSSVKSFEKCTN